ncbi:hypothetical protein ElyMa_003460100 [Elysia marginata]|uniref:Secreted protein n=1 Tax=Elysia marginata TaxID=1093978 RepID=A0AAV4E9T2_9GAST|nr:hypothetical protein ElyMa_003460100 [Elysia marginata]
MTECFPLAGLVEASAWTVTSQHQAQRASNDRYTGNCCPRHARRSQVCVERETDIMSQYQSNSWSVELWRFGSREFP